jgi:hypothetical protein
MSGKGRRLQAAFTRKFEEEWIDRRLGESDRQRRRHDQEV